MVPVLAAFGNSGFPSPAAPAPAPAAPAPALSPFSNDTVALATPAPPLAVFHSYSTVRG
jgi:hypothetical protein